MYVMSDANYPSRTPSETQWLRDEIIGLKNRLNAIIVAHNYQIPEVQDIADFVGDSLELARLCAEANAGTIVFCGVDFMAETAYILKPGALVLLAAAGACCPMSQMINISDLAEWKQRYPDAAVVCYVNSSAEIKAASDICCTSANAVRVVESLLNDRVLFVPDRNLGHYVSTKVKKEIILYPGFCATHDRLTVAEVTAARVNYPGAAVIVHPECRPEVVAVADAVLSTSQMLRYVKESPGKDFLVGTEEGVMHRMTLENPDKNFYLISPSLLCENMKKTRLETVVHTMQAQWNRITVPEAIRLKAKRSLDRMLAVV